MAQLNVEQNKIMQPNGKQITENMDLQHRNVDLNESFPLAEHAFEKLRHSFNVGVNVVGQFLATFPLHGTRRRNKHQISKPSWLATSTYSV